MILTPDKALEQGLPLHYTECEVNLLRRHMYMDLCIMG